MVMPIGDVNPTHRAPIVTWLLLLTNAGVFILLQLPADACDALAFTYTWGAVPAELTGAGPLHPGDVEQLLGPCADAVGAVSTQTVALSLLSAMFVHGNLGHLIGNLLFLYVFGNNVEDRLGRLRFLGFYLVGGVAATVAFVALQPDSTVPLVGASGAIAAVLGAYLLVWPRAQVFTFVPFPLYLVALIVPKVRIRSFWLLFAIVSLPAWLLLGGWIAFQTWAARSELSDGTAYSAHVAGFVAGILLLLLLDRRRARDGRPTFHPTRRR